MLFRRETPQFPRMGLGGDGIKKGKECSIGEVKTAGCNISEDIGIPRKVEDFTTVAVLSLLETG